ncbi:hypothetical protein VF14_01950 [Nostoc linckia z18]|jgi:hypothetical protein|uniref:Uncharacterized protein n=3 Tax=Nostoc TaxID=1177 RepID=A0A9Q5ZGE7_NOSLI|nr:MULTISPECIES: hypothetical protein [Nostoc]MDZ8011347.1 hypothetical protein [Nostoc sp. ZfuVER08]PHK40358.1 hypothetical protein VF12_10920 [Nostoc linckia z15]PHK48207.1 hypothetical protein VF13_01390 [Nostoc linckia z16]MBC1235777.1 hypothetical protein [Nostoc sp. 2RC]MBD2613370.1 hypothetical protein [Nostoc punctiforme FACHB-252]
MSAKLTQIFKVIEDTITKPPIPHEPYKQSLKAWAMYCLRDRGFKVVYAQNADFAIETKGEEKLYFKVSNSDDDLDNSISWIVWDSTTKTATFVPQNI